jgi:HK97 family phage major capsid protein
MSEPKQIELDEKKFNEIISDTVGKALATNLDQIMKGIGEKVGKIVDKKIEEKGLNKIDRSFMGAIDKEEVGKMERSERFAQFVKSLVGGDQAKSKALSEGNDTEGGYLVPEETQKEILRVMEDYGIIRKLARVIPMKRETKSVPRLTSSVSVYWPGENNAGTESNPVFGNVELIARTAVGICTTSIEFLEDADADIESYLVELFAEALAGEEDNQGLNGSGAPFVGVLQDADVTVETMDTGDDAFADIDADYLRTMIASVKTSLLSGAAFVMEKSVWALIQNLKDTNQQYLVSMFNPVINSGDAGKGYGLQPAGYIWGQFPVYLSDKMPGTTSSAAATKFIIFGNFNKGFLLGDRKQVGIAVSKEATVGGESSFERNKMAIRVTERIAEAIGIPSAFVVLKTATN